MINLTKNEVIFSDKLPLLTIIVGPCRVGTTALANLFSKAGIITYLQPLKSARRAIEAGNESVKLYFNNDESAVLKETIGAHSEAEYFNPVKDLIDLGYPKDRIQLIAIVRNPTKTLASWKEMWDDVEFSKFVEAYELTAAIKKYSKNLGIKTISFVHEATRENAPKIVVQKLFDALGYSNVISSQVINWNSGPLFGEENPNTSMMKFFDVPPERFVKEVKYWGKYQFREEPELTLSNADALNVTRNNKLNDIYDEFLKDSTLDLSLKICGLNIV